ncbi:hypothetical protein N9D31_03960 [Oligoflexaceae bacterium]|nr:hypothetical protein [Oligoflexaceae bacterium]
MVFVSGTEPASGVLGVTGVAGVVVLKSSGILSCDFERPKK